MVVFPAEDRPILLAVYICPTDAHKGAQHACHDERLCQTGRKHLPGFMSTRPTCIRVASALPWQSGRSCHSANPVPCPTSKPVLPIWAGPTEVCHSHPCPGASTAPSRPARHVQGLPGSLPPYNVRDAAWDKIPRLGEAKNPGPEPPRELYLDRRTTGPHQTLYSEWRLGLECTLCCSTPEARATSLRLPFLPPPLARQVRRSRKTAKAQRVGPRKMGVGMTSRSHAQTAAGRQHIPRELKALWQRIVHQLLTTEQSRTDVYPIASDLVFILPKLLLSHPPGKEKARDRLHRVQNCFQRAFQGEWKGLIERVFETPVPNYEQDESQPLATCADSLPPRTARRLFKAASQGQLGKAWRQLRAPPPVHIGPDQWNEALAKLPHEKPEGPPHREDITPERWFPTPREHTHATSPN